MDQPSVRDRQSIDCVRGVNLLSIDYVGDMQSIDCVRHVRGANMQSIDYVRGVNMSMLLLFRDRCCGHSFLVAWDQEASRGI